MFNFLFSASLAAFAATMAFAVYACCLLGLYLADGVGIPIPFKELIAAACAVLMLGLTWRALPALGKRLGAVHADRLWLLAVLLGLFMRLGTWLISLPEVQINDGLHYLELATRLSRHQSYELNGYAFWPPGTPFIYTAFMHVLGQPAWIAVVINCSFFVLTALSMRSLGRSLRLTARDTGCAVLVLALWPALFLTTAQVSKEVLLIGMLPTVLALALLRRPWAWLAAGCVAGLAILTQPSLVFLPLLIGVALLAARITPKTVLMRMVLLGIGTVLVIAPWTYRNYQVFGEFIPVSTNAGLVLHAGNQPAMVKPLGVVGGFLEPPAPSTPMKNDLLLSRWHKGEAQRFMLAHPGDFAKLVWNRVVITMGDDSDSAYRSLRLTRKVSDKAYLLSKMLSNAYWMIIAALLATSCWSLRKRAAAHDLAPLSMLVALATLYLMAVHGLAEGGSRHHMAWSWAYALMLAAGMARMQRHLTAPLAQGMQAQAA